MSWLKKVFKSERPLCFGCNQCGDCCRQMRIPLSHMDLLRIREQNPDLPLFDWLQFYPVEENHPDAIWLNQTTGILLLRQQDGACLFLKNNQCGVYNYRPRVCRIWPFETAPQSLDLRIAPQHEMLVKLACDKTPFPPEEATAIQNEIEHIAREYSVYNLLIQRWNQQKRSAINNNKIEDFVQFLKESAA